jgi:hypothetical protein
MLSVSHCGLRLPVVEAKAYAMVGQTSFKDILDALRPSPVESMWNK